ncbi:MAG: hypothetical protein R3F30_09310 [Planctomycetota bacterium]
MTREDPRGPDPRPDGHPRARADGLPAGRGGRRGLRRGGRELHELRDGLLHRRGPGGPPYVSATEGFLREFTANLLGLEEDEVDIARYGPHAMHDLANLIGGEVVVMLGGSEEDSPLCRPELCDAEQLEAELAGQEEEPLCCWLDSEGEVLRVQVVLTQVAAA